MQSCVDNCSTQGPTCVGAIWDHNTNTCWMKSTIPAATSTSDPNIFAILRPVPVCGSAISDGQGGSWTVQCDANIWGNDIQSVSATTMNSCVAACSTYGPGCKAVTWLSQTATCWLKNAAPSASPAGANSGIYSAVAPALPTCGQTFTDSTGKVWTTQCGFNWFGSDLKNVSSSTMQSCMDNCSAQGPTCAGAIWDHNTNTCWMKSTIPAATSTSDPNIFAILRPVPACGSAISSSSGDFMIYCDSNVSGNDIESVPATSMGSCVSACSKYGPSCHGVVWNSESSTCWLKNAIGSITSTVAHSGLYTALAPQPACGVTFPTFKGTAAILCNRNPVGAAMYSLGSPSALSCTDTCALDNKCKAAAWDPKSQTCYVAYSWDGTAKASTLLGISLGS